MVKCYAMFELTQIRRISFIALLAMLMVVLAPTVSKVVAFKRVGINLVEICSTQGKKWVSSPKLDQKSLTYNEQAPSSEHAHNDDCPYCNLQTAKFITTKVQFFSSVEIASLLPTLFSLAPKPLFAWASRPARAPPSVS